MQATLGRGWVWLSLVAGAGLFNLPPGAWGKALEGSNRSGLRSCVPVGVWMGGRGKQVGELSQP